LFAFVGSHLVRRLKSEGYRVRGVGIKQPEFSPFAEGKFLLLDLREAVNCLVRMRLLLLHPPKRGIKDFDFVTKHFGFASTQRASGIKGSDFVTTQRGFETKQSDFAGKK
jgi:nucleoside-diphosphate-sugar epimerase